MMHLSQKLNGLLFWITLYIMTMKERLVTRQSHKSMLCHLHIYTTNTMSPTTVPCHTSLIAVLTSLLRVVMSRCSVCTAVKPLSAMSSARPLLHKNFTLLTGSQLFLLLGTLQQSSFALILLHPQNITTQQNTRSRCQIPPVKIIN